MHITWVKIILFILKIVNHNRNDFTILVLASPQNGTDNSDTPPSDRNTVNSTISVEMDQLRVKGFLMIIPTLGFCPNLEGPILWNPISSSGQWWLLIKAVLTIYGTVKLKSSFNKYIFWYIVDFIGNMDPYYIFYGPWN